MVLVSTLPWLVWIWRICTSSDIYIMTVWCTTLSLPNKTLFNSYYQEASKLSRNIIIHKTLFIRWFFFFEKLTAICFRVKPWAPPTDWHNYEMPSVWIPTSIPIDLSVLRILLYGVSRNGILQFSLNIIKKISYIHFDL